MKNTESTKTELPVKKEEPKLSRKKMARKKNELMQVISNEDGKLGWIFLWLIGIPVPVLLVLFLIRGCT